MRATPPLLVVSLLASACGGSGDPAPPPADDLAPPPEGRGIQLSLTTSIQPGEDVERCKLVQVDRELRVNRDEVRYTRGSHHFLLYLTPYSTIPTVALTGESVDTSDTFDCTEAGPSGMFELTSLVGGAQNAGGASTVSFPPGVAMTVPAGSVLLMNAHYLNATTEVLEPEVRINLWTLPPEEVHTEGGLLFWYHPFLHVGPRAESRARASCVIPREVKLVNTQSHMHRRGVGYDARLLSGDTVNVVYENDSWSDVPIWHHGPGLTLPAGSVLEYGCHYRNDEARDVWEGPRTTDEMCMLIGSYYPRVQGLDYYSADPLEPVKTQMLGLRFLGEGNATCAQSFACARAAFESRRVKEDLTLCVEEASPAVAAELGAALACALQLEEGDDPLVRCAEPFAACLAK